MQEPEPEECEEAEVAIPEDVAPLPPVSEPGQQQQQPQQQPQQQAPQQLGVNCIKMYGAGIFSHQ